MTAVDARQTEIERASTLELFLDLVFVFTVTQLTDLVAHPHGVTTTGRPRSSSAPRGGCTTPTSG